MYSKLIFVALVLGIGVTILYRDKVPCDLHNDVCVTEAAQSLVKMIAAGSPSWGIEGSDPLRRDRINGNMPNLNYTINNGNLHGFQNCSVHKLNFMRNSSWYLYLICPCLTLKSNYETVGEIASVFVEGKGNAEIIHDNYHIGLRGEYEIITGADFKPHITIKNYEIDVLDVKDIVIYKLSNLYYGDEEKSKKVHKYCNENWKKISIGTHHPAIYSFMGKLINNMNKFFTILPIQDLFFIKKHEL